MNTIRGWGIGGKDLIRGWLALLVVPVILLAAGPAMPQQADTPAVFPEARAAAAEDDHIRAWRLVLAAEAESPGTWQEDPDFVRERATRVVAQLRALRDADRYDEALQLSDLLRDSATIDLVGSVFPDNVSQFNDQVRIQTGLTHLRRGQAESFRERLDRAVEDYREAVSLLARGDPEWVRVNYLLALGLADQGEIAFAGAAQAATAGDPATEQRLRQEATRLFNEAVPFAVEALTDATRQGREATDPTVTQNMAGFYRSANELLGFLDGLVTVPIPLPTPTPAPTPTPEPGPLDSYLPPSIVQFFNDVQNDPATRNRVLTIAGIIVGFIVLYWVLPLFTLQRMEHGGDIAAVEWKRWVRLLGIFALLGYFYSKYFGEFSTGGRKGKSGVPGGKQVCPNCEHPLDNMFGYEDLVFSRCPKCRTKIVPLYTVEEYVDTIAKGMGADLERVNTGALSLEEYVKKDAVLRLIRAVITLGVRRRASDVHIEPDEAGLLVRQRVDGIMTLMFKLPRSLSLALVSAIKVMANLDIAEKRVPQDGKFQMQIDGVDIDVRVASSPTSAGEKVSLRLLDIRSIQMTPEHLGMPEDAREKFLRGIHQPHGMILVTGPTGSGKTTTIYVALQEILTGDKNIISIEDPIEFRIPGVNQIQVNPTAGLTFAGGLRSILRQDPDVIVVGEIRDRETAEISVNAVLTGHLVYSTLHTVDASSSVARLIELGVSPRQFADALSLVVAQRLIRLVCQYCRVDDQPDEATLRELGIHPEHEAEFQFVRGEGCKVCNSTGYYRRTGLFELLQPTERLRVELEAGQLSTGKIREIAIAAGMRTLRQEALALMRQGRTSAEETLRVTK